MDIEHMLGMEYAEMSAEKPVEPYWYSLQNGDNSAASGFLKEMELTINKAISAFAQGDNSHKTQARLLALDAAKSFNPTKGADIKTHVFNNLKRLQRTSAQRGNLLHIPEQVAIDRGIIMRAMREYEADNGIEPTTEQIANITGMNVKRIDAVMNHKPVTSDSLTSSPEGDNLVGYKPDSALELYDRMIYDELDATDKRIYEWTTGFGKAEKLPSNEIARRLNISPAAVSKRSAKIADKFARDRELVRQFS